jgi:hypothetical protein
MLLSWEVKQIFKSSLLSSNVLLVDCMNKLFLLNPSFIPSKELECRTSFFKVLILLQRIPIGSGSKREENLNNLLNFIKPVVRDCDLSNLTLLILCAH